MGDEQQTSGTAIWVARRPASFGILIAMWVLMARHVRTATAVPTCTISFTGGAGTATWGTAGNWAPTRLPTSSDWVCIPSAASHLPTNLDGAATVSGMTADGGLTILASGSLTLTDNVDTATVTGWDIGGTSAPRDQSQLPVH